MADRDSWFKFRPDYWLTDPELRLCSGRARGALIDTMSLMHYSSKYGFLLTNESKADLTQVAKQLVWPAKTYQNAIKELLDNGVLEQDEQGVIYCPRMVSDREKRERGIEDGKKGGNPKLKPQGVNPPAPKRVNPETDTDKEQEKEKKQEGKPPGVAQVQGPEGEPESEEDAGARFKAEADRRRQLKQIGKTIPQEITNEAADETAHERRAR